MLLELSCRAMANGLVGLLVYHNGGPLHQEGIVTTKVLLLTIRVLLYLRYLPLSYHAYTCTHAYTSFCFVQTITHQREIDERTAPLLECARDRLLQNRAPV